MELDGPRREIYPSRKIWFGWSSTGCNGSLLSIVWRWKVSIARYLLRSDRESILTGWKLIYRDFDFHRVSFRLPPFIGFRSSLSFAFYSPLIFFSFFSLLLLLPFVPRRLRMVQVRQLLRKVRFVASMNRTLPSLLLFTSF